MLKSNLLQQYEYPFLSVESFYRNSSTWTQGRKVKMEAKLSHGQMRFSLPRRRSWASFTRPRTSAWEASCTWLTIETAFQAFKVTFELTTTGCKILDSRPCSHYAKFCLVCKKNCQREAISSANDFFHPPKFLQALQSFKDSFN